MTTAVDSAPAADTLAAAPQARVLGAWRGEGAAAVFDERSIRTALLELDRRLLVVRVDGRVGVGRDGALAEDGDGEVLAIAPPLPAEQLGDPSFRSDHGVALAYAAGAMANGIASESFVTALGRAGLLATFGAAGLAPSHIDEAIKSVQRALPEGPYAFSLIHSPSGEALEHATVELYLERGVRTVEASAFLRLTPHVVRYRLAGLEEAPDGGVVTRNRLIAKVSRREIATHFLSPAPAGMVRDLVQEGWMTERQARLAERVPLADDLTVEADSGGHTDNRPLVVLLPSIAELRDELHARHGYVRVPRVGAAGGIGTPAAVAAAFAMGAAYVVTGSINQACVEAGTSPHTRALLAQADYADVAMAPAADMFEMGVEVQVLKRGTFFPMRARRLYDLYRSYASLEEIPAAERARLESQYFGRPLDAVWEETVAYFSERDPRQIARAADDPKHRMALVFRWYLGLTSQWANTGEPGREMDYQIWCGPAMGAFNDWARGSVFEAPAGRRAAEVGRALMDGAAYLLRLTQLETQGIRVGPGLRANAARARGLEHFGPGPGRGAGLVSSR